MDLRRLVLLPPGTAEVMGRIWKL